MLQQWNSTTKTVRTEKCRRVGRGFLDIERVLRNVVTQEQDYTFLLLLLVIIGEDQCLGKSFCIRLN